MIDEYIDQLLHSHFGKWSNPLLKTRVIEVIKEAMRDQRHACAESLTTLPKYSRYDSDLRLVKFDEAHAAVMNAEPKEE